MASISPTVGKISIDGYKSIRKLVDFKLRTVNVLIGPNGAGKSNFVSFFRLLHDLIEERLQVHVATDGGADASLYLGPRETKELAASIVFGNNEYDFSLTPTADNRFVFQHEHATYMAPDGSRHPRDLVRFP